MAVQVNYIHPTEILISLKKAQQHYIGYEIISPDSIRHLPPTPLSKSLRICMNLMGGPWQGPPSSWIDPVAMPLVVAYTREFWTEFTHNITLGCQGVGSIPWHFFCVTFFIHSSFIR